MKLNLSENIRSFRKQRKITQEKLAEALGVTVGAVYKWESGQSLPELNMLVEMADFFDTSVDLLLGYKMKDNRLDATLERLNQYSRTLDPAAISEAEKAVGKYPQSFRIVYFCARVYLGFGASYNDHEHLRRALELFERSILLLPQNNDQRINESMIYANMSTVWFLLGEQDKCLELLKNNNPGGIFCSKIGLYLAVYMDNPKEAAPYLSEGLLSSIGDFITSILGYVFVFRSRNDWDSALAITGWGMDILSGLKTETETDFQDKVQTEMLALQAYVQKKAGRKKESYNTLQQAAAFAQHFDSTPDYSLAALRFADQADQILAYDILGPTASGSVANLLSLLGDQELVEQWKKMTGDEQ